MSNFLTRNSSTGRVTEQPLYNTASGTIVFSTAPARDATAFVTIPATWATSSTVLRAIPDPAGVGHGHTLEEFVLEDITLTIHSVIDGVSVRVMGYAPRTTSGSYDIKLIGLN